MCDTVDLKFNRSQVKMLLRIATKYGDKKIFGSPTEKEAFDKIMQDLHIALFELEFKKKN